VGRGFRNANRDVLVKGGPIEISTRPFQRFDDTAHVIRPTTFKAETGWDAALSDDFSE
jgi:hypothetical protein